MHYTKELNLTSFNFWSGAKQHSFSYSELQELEFHLAQLFHDNPPTETKINDIFWFEEEFLCECLNIDLEEYENRA